MKSSTGNLLVIAIESLFCAPFSVAALGEDGTQGGTGVSGRVQEGIPIRTLARPASPNSPRVLVNKAVAKLKVRGIDREGQSLTRMWKIQMSGLEEMRQHRCSGLRVTSLIYQQASLACRYGS